MKTNIFLTACLALVLYASSACAGWYEIKNYVGTVGSAPVHISLQTYDYINHGEPSQWRIDGSYYYDAHRIPIPLQGQRKPDGQMVLCEAAEPLSVAESPLVPKASATHPVPCPITLKFAEDSASGEWNDGKKILPIALHQVGNLDDTHAIRLEGIVEIPMWHRTKSHMLLGIYQSSEGCPVSMRYLRLINIATGRIDKDIPFTCDAGMITTPIYLNVSRGPSAREVTVGFQGGRMGYDEVVDLEQRPVKRK